MDTFFSAIVAIVIMLYFLVCCLLVELGEVLIPASCDGFCETHCYFFYAEFQSSFFLFLPSLCLRACLLCAPSPMSRFVIQAYEYRTDIQYANI